MKKRLLLSMLALAGTTSLFAQTTKTPFIEHFTQASCGPCAGQNPAMKATLDNFGTANYVRVSHQVSWPGVDPMNAAFPAGPNDRRGYYGITTVPQTVLNGGTPDFPNTVVTASTLASESSVSTPYSIAATQSWADANTVTVSIDVINLTAAAVSDADKIYVSMVEEHVEYASAPGSNGETDFEYVLREMYNASTGAAGATSGTALPSIAANGTETFTFTLTSIPSYVSSKGEIIFAVYIQNDASKEIWQAGKTSYVPIPGLIDVAASSTSTAGTGYCDYAFNPSIDFVNNDPSATVTEVIAEYSINGNTPVQQTFAGSLTNGQSTTIAFPAVTFSSGTNDVTYNIVSVNGAQDWVSNSAVSIAGESYAKLATTSAAAPVSEDLETATYTGFLSRDVPTGIFESEVDIMSFAAVDGPAAQVGAIGGYAQSDKSIICQFYAVQTGEMNFIMNKINLGTSSSLSFDHAYRQYQSENDKLEIFVSTDCGSNWTSIFSEQGASLMTLPAATAQFFPSAAGDWETTEIDLSAYDNTNDVVIKFTATSDYGNNLFIDNINVGDAANVEDLEGSQFSTYPNPATDKVTVKLAQVESADARVEILDIKGQVVLSNVLTSGQSKIDLNTSSLASGVYTVRVASESGLSTQRVVIK